jgi:hypothetical protein
MKRIVIFLALIATINLFPACSKGGGGGGGGGNPPNEANLVVDIDPANGIVQAPSLGPFNLKVTISSTMPSGGVKIEVSAKKDDGSGSAAFFTSSANTSTSVSNINITNTPSSVQCLVEVKVTSLSKSSNTWSGSYRYSRK